MPPEMRTQTAKRKICLSMIAAGSLNLVNLNLQKRPHLAASLFLTPMFSLGGTRV